MRGDGLVETAREVLGEEGFMLFCHAFGGTRVYVPLEIPDDCEIVRAIGRPLAEKLSQALSPDTIRVPLLRKERAIWLRKNGSTNAQIARRLGMTEQGVNSLFARARASGEL